MTPLQKSIAADILADYVSDRPATLARLIELANVEQFGKLFPVLNSHGDKAVRELRNALLRDPLDGQKEASAVSRANVACALLKMGVDTTAWKFLRFDPNPTLRSSMIDRMAKLEVPPAIIVRQLLNESDVSIRRGLLQTLGELRDRAAFGFRFACGAAQNRTLVRKRPRSRYSWLRPMATFPMEV